MKRKHTTALLLGGAIVAAVVLARRQKSQPVQGLGRNLFSSAFNAAAHIASAPVRLAEQAVLTPAKIIAQATSTIPVLSQITAANLKLTSGIIAAGNRVAQASINIVGSQQIHTPGTEAAPSAQQGAAAVGVANGVVFVEQYNGHSVWVRVVDNSFVVDYTTVPSPSFALGPFPSQVAAEQAIDQTYPAAQSNGGAPFPDGSYQPAMNAVAPASSSNTGLLTLLGVGAAGAGAYLLAK